MASLIPGFEYDIFISYRQKDNKGERWVSEFVEALKTELESTFKEEVSVYFDINPHDGLLETHDVNASLREKLKCLIFIPIISRTYCDPRSFAWQYEFRAFIEQAADDRFGLKVRLSSGNISSRVLPVRIHELAPDDTKLCESMLGGILRGVDFIYKSPGVNRPLLSNEDHPRDNQNRTYYRDQINKVANAIDDIIHGLLQEEEGQTDRSPGKERKTITDRKKRKGEVKRWVAANFTTRRLMVFTIFAICILAGFLIYKAFYKKNVEKTVAILPLRISNNDTSLKNEADYFIESVNDKLNMIKRVSLKPAISTLQFRNSDKPLEAIGRELKTNYLLDGNIRKERGDIKIWIELSAARKKEMLWSKTYIWDKNHVNQITQEIVRAVATSLELDLSPVEERLISMEPSKYADANMNYISANAMLKNAWSYFNYGDKMMDSTSFYSVIEKYGKAIKEDSMLAAAYAKRAITISWGFNDRQVDSSYLGQCRNDIDKALSIDPDLAEAQIALGFYYYYCEVDYDKALFHFGKAAGMMPGDYQPIYYQSLVYRRMGKWKETLDLTNQVIRMNPLEALFLTNIGLTYTYLHKYDSSILYHQKAIDHVPGWSAAYKNKLQAQLMKNGKTGAAREVMQEAIRKTGDNMIEDKIRINIYEKNYSEAFKIAKSLRSADYNIGGTRYIYLAEISALLNKPEDAKMYYDSALVVIRKDLIEYPDWCTLHAMAGLAYAGNGNKAEAVSEGELAIKLSEKNGMDNSDMKLYLAQIFTMTGDFDNAASLIIYLINNPSLISEKLLILDPFWKPIIGNREFKKMIKKI